MMTSLMDNRMMRENLTILNGQALLLVQLDRVFYDNKMCAVKNTGMSLSGIKNFQNNPFRNNFIITFPIDLNANEKSFTQEWE